MTARVPPTRTNWRLVVLLLVAGLFAGAQFGKLTLTLEALRAQYPGGAAFVPVLVSIVGMVGIVFAAVAGATVMRLGLAWTLTAALVLGGALSLMQAALPPLGLFAVLRVFEGASHLAIVVIAPTMLASIASEADRPVVMGIWACFFGLSLAILAAVLPGVLGAGGLPLLFLLHGGGMIMLAVILWPALPHGLTRDAPRPGFLREHAIIYTTPRLMIPGGGFVWYTILYIALLAGLPALLALPAWAVTALPLISIIGTLAGGWIAKSLAADRVVLLGFAGTFLSAPLLLVWPGALAPLFVMFFVMALIPAGCFAAIPQFNPSTTDRARATGGIAQLGNVGTTLGTPIFVLLADHAGIAAVTALTAVFCLLGIASVTLLGRAIGRASGEV